MRERKGLELQSLCVSSSIVFPPLSTNQKKPGRPAAAAGRACARSRRAPWPCLLGAGSPCPQLSRWRRTLGQTKAGAASFCFSNCYKALAVSRRCRRSDMGREPERNLALSSSPRHRILIQTLSAMEITSCFMYIICVPLERFIFSMALQVKRGVDPWLCSCL
jgi:hypothetical protein